MANPSDRYRNGTLESTPDGSARRMAALDEFHSTLAEKYTARPSSARGAARFLSTAFKHGSSMPASRSGFGARCATSAALLERQQLFLER